MTKLWVDKQARLPSEHSNVPSLPRLYLSSTQAGWEGLNVRAFHEPKEVESWRVPATSDINLELFTGGALRIERREAQGSWKGCDMYHGDLFLHWGGASYESRWWNLSRAPAHSVDLHLSRELVARVAQEMAGVDLESLELAGRARFTDPLLTQIAITLRQELEQPAPASNLYAQTAAQLIAAHLVRHYISNGARLSVVPPPKGLTKRQIQQVLEFIRAHLDENLSLETLAQEVGFSSYHFARLFRQATGASLHQMVLRQRIERAQRLLRDTELPLAQVANECGFAHQSHLTQVFKQQLGCTPGAYREARN